MRKLKVFESITSNGYFAGEDGDLSWAYAGSQDAEFQRFVQGNASFSAVLLFGRVTYEMMASYWPTPMAAQNDSTVAVGMNAATKIVFSRTLRKAAWQNTRLEKDVVTAVRKLKQEQGDDLVVLGSGSIVEQLASAGLVDELQVVVKPVALGAGKTLLAGLDTPLSLTLTSSRAFANGNVVMTYAVART